MDLMKRFTDYLDMQYKTPEGLFGFYLAEKMIRQHRPETEWTIKLINPQQGETLLELGCGAGFAIKCLLDQSSIKQVTGYDLSSTVLKSAKMRNRKEVNIGRAKLIQGDVKELPFQDEDFNKVFSIHSVYFWNDLSNTVSEIYRVIKPGGKIFITLCDGRDGETWDNIKRMLEQDLFPELEQSGFKNVDLMKGPDSRQFHTVTVVGEKEK